MPETLHGIAERYLKDQPYIDQRKEVAIAREDSLPALQALVQAYTIRRFTFEEFCTELEHVLRRGEDWGAAGFGFMMELKKFGKYHIGPDNTARETFRTLVDGLNRQNVGQRI